MALGTRDFIPNKLVKMRGCVKHTRVPETARCTVTAALPPCRIESDAPAQYNAAMDSLSPEAGAALRTLVDEYRHRCLWFLRPDYYPATIAEAERVLEAIQRHGDRDGFRRAARVRQWLSRSSSATSVGS
jgi:hypothetical protein